MAWKTNTLSFNDASLEEVFKSLEHYFNIRITVENTRIHNCHFTGEFVKPTFKQVMDVIGKTLQLTYEQKGKQVLVKGKGCE
jgi:ferric-dicitrate binding protein FerR (iron transport regulator)